MATEAELRAGLKAILKEHGGVAPAASRPSAPGKKIRDTPKAAAPAKHDKQVARTGDAASSKPAAVKKSTTATPPAIAAPAAAPTSATRPAAAAVAVPAAAPAAAVASKSRGSRKRARLASADASAAAATAAVHEANLSRLSSATLYGKLHTGDGNWYEAPCTSRVSSATIDAGIVERYRSAAQRLLTSESDAFESKRESSGGAEAKWMRTVLSGGTASDKLAALTLLVQQSPLHALRHLDALLGLARKQSRRESLDAVAALKDLFLTNLLPPDRKLLSLQVRPLDSKDVRVDELVLWYFEEQLKSRYADMVTVLHTHVSDALSHFKLVALRSAWELLTERAEGEAALLAMIVNKLGDPDGKVSSAAMRHLQQLLERHTAMMGVVVRELHQFLYRPNIASGAKYYGVLFLNQLTLQRSMPDVAVDLINTYMSLFELSLKNKTVDSRLLSALLTGINRAFPFTGSVADSPSQRKLEERADTLFDTAEKATFSTAVQALMVLHKLAENRLQMRHVLTAPAGADMPTVTDKFIKDGRDKFVNHFYRCLYARLDVTGLSSTNKYGLFLNLLFKAMKQDPELPRVCAFVKRLLQCAQHLPANDAAGALFLTAELLSVRVQLRDMLTAPPSERVSAPVLGTAACPTCEPDALALLHVQVPPRVHTSATDETAPATADVAGEAVQAHAVLASMRIPASGVRAAAALAEDGAAAAATTAGRVYHPTATEPLHCNADREALWEVLPLAVHHHPTVRVFADALLANAGVPISYKGDPLADLSLVAFLDRFVYKNPKQRNLAAFGEDAAANRASKASAPAADTELEEGYALVQGKDVAAERALAAGLVHGTSIMQKRAPRHGHVDVDMPVNTAEFVAADASSVRPEELFMHTYFRTKAAQEAETGMVAGRKRRRADDELADVTGAVVDDETAADAFADDLAEQLMRSAGGGDVDEDPDWALDDGVADDGEDMNEDMDDVDAPDGMEEDDGDDVRYADADEEEENAYEGEAGTRLDADVSDDEELDDALAGAAMEEMQELDDVPAPARSKKETGSSIFADADEYAHLLNSDADDVDDEPAVAVQPVRRAKHAKAAAVKRDKRKLGGERKLKQRG